MVQPTPTATFRSSSRKTTSSMHGTDDQVVPYADAGPLSAKLLKNATLKTYEGYPHGMLSTNPDVLNPDILAFIKAKA